MEGRSRANSTYDFGLLALQHAFGVVGEDDLLIDYRAETDARLLGALRVTSDEIVDLESVYASHALEQGRRVATEAAAPNLRGDEGEVGLGRIAARDI